MLNLEGEITQKGSKVDFDDVPGVARPIEDNSKGNGIPVLTAPVIELRQEPEERVFEIDDFDFLKAKVHWIIQICYNLFLGTQHSRMLLPVALSRYFKP